MGDVGGAKRDSDTTKGGVVLLVSLTKPSPGKMRLANLPCMVVERWAENTSCLFYGELKRARAHRDHGRLLGGIRHFSF